MTTGLVTSRLTLNLLEPGHVPLLLEARRESFAQLKAWNIFTPEQTVGELNPTDEAAMCAARIHRITQRESLFYSVFRQHDRRLLGNVALTRCDWKQRLAMLGFWIRSMETGKGYATEAAQALLHHARQLGLHPYSMHAAGNQASRAVLLKLGFQATLIKPCEQQLPDGRLVDEVYYELPPVSA